MNRFRYLNGIDWVIAGLDRSLRRTHRIGNWSQLVLELEGQVDFDRFSDAVQRYASCFPVLQGKAVRGWQLAPLWKIPKRGRPINIPVEKQHLPDNSSRETVIERLGRCVTVPSGTPGQYIGFNLLYTTENTALAFRFDHRLFDARGAELFLQGLVRFVEDGCRPVEEHINLHPQKPCLSPWVSKFLSGKKIIRLLRSQQQAVASFDLTPRADTDSKINFSVIQLNQKQSDALLDRAYSEAGYLMLTPWLAERITVLLDQLQPASAKSLKGYMIPCSTDLRTDPDRQMFFNHVAFICLSRPSGGAPDGGWGPVFSKQLVEQAKQEIPLHFENAWKLARILPISLYGNLMCGSLRSFGGTLSVASVGDGLSSIETFCGLNVKNAFHMPVVPPSPGLGFFANTFNGRLNFCLTSSSTVLADTEHYRLAELLEVELQNL